MTLNPEKVYTKNNVLLPRSGHKIVADNKYLYVIGGYVEIRYRTIFSSSENEVRGEIWRLHFVYKTWEKCIFDKELFNLSASHSATKHGDCIFITGGTGLPFGANILDHLIVVNVKNMTQKSYQFIPKSGCVKNLPIATYGHSLTFVEIHNKPYLFIIGGTVGTKYHQEVYKIDLMTLESTIVADGDSTNAPRPRYKHESFFYGDHIYLLGGTTQTSSTFSLDQIHLFNVHTNVWKTHKTNDQFKINKGLRCPSMCQNGQYIYLTGGCPNSQEISTDIQELDLTTLSWRVIGKWEKPCFFHDSVFVPHLGSMFTFGGVSRILEPPKRTNDLYEFKPVSARISPTLTDLSWKLIIEILLRVNARKAGDCGANLLPDLVRMGLPLSIINRIGSPETNNTHAA